MATSIGLAFRKLDVFGYYKFVTAVKNINLLPDRSSVMKQKKMKAISGFAFKGITAAVAAIYLVLFGLSFWNIFSYNAKLKDYDNVLAEHAKSVKQKKVVSKELKLMDTTLKLSRTLKSNKELTYRILAQVASSVPKRVRFDKVEFNGTNTLTIQGVAATDQDILKFIDNLSKQKLVQQASLSSMRLPKTSAGSATMKGFRVFVKIKKRLIMDMNIDLKNLNISDLKEQILKLADKKTLIKIGIVAGSILLFLIIYYAVLNPMVETRKAKLDDMNLKKEETQKFITEINSMKRKIKKLKPQYQQYSTLFHSKAEVEGLYQTLSEYAGQNDLVISKIEKRKIKPVLKAQALASVDGKEEKSS